MTQTMHIAEPLFRRLTDHLFPGDGDEHGAVLVAGVAQTPRGTRFLGRDVLLARDGTDYVAGTHGYRALTAGFVARTAHLCGRDNLCYFAVHNHGGRDAVAFSDVDLASQQRGYPALIDITKGGPVGALVFAQNAVAGKIWRRSGTANLDSLIVVGRRMQHFYPSPQLAPLGVEPMYSRQSLLFGAAGQRLLRETKVGIIGLGGVGSLISQWLTHLGIGHIIGIDLDSLEPSNRPRVVTATAWDAGEPFVHSRFSILRLIGRLLARRKVDIAARAARRANRAIQYEPIFGDITDIATAMRLTDVGYLFLCADTMQSRLVFNALVHQYLIPGVQIGSKVPAEKTTGAIQDVFLVARPVLPFPLGGCLSCNQLIPPDRLQDEMLTPEERRRQRYVDDVAIAVPSVITLNAHAAAQAVDDFLFGFLGLTYADAVPGYLMYQPRQRRWRSVECRADAACLHCGTQTESAYARGDRATLPCRLNR
jgi:molybdopterin/thiamine biosynthesis adenylyltransferase